MGNYRTEGNGFIRESARQSRVMAGLMNELGGQKRCRDFDMEWQPLEGSYSLVFIEQNDSDVGEVTASFW